MNYTAFKVLCEREYDNGFGNVTELHLTQEARDELVNSIPDIRQWEAHSVTGILNPTTGNMVEITVHRNHAVVMRQPPPPPTRHEVLV